MSYRGSSYLDPAFFASSYFGTASMVVPEEDNGGDYFESSHFASSHFSGAHFGISSDAPLPEVFVPQRPVFGWPVYSDRSVSHVPSITGGAWETTLPLSNVLDRRLARPARSVDTAMANTQFTVNLSVARAIGVLALPAHQLSSAATVRWEASATSDFATILYDSGAVPAWPAGATREDLNGLNVSHVVVLETDVTAQYWRCRINDTTNPLGYVQIARVMICGAWRASRYLSTGAKLGLETATERIVSDGGAAMFLEKPIRRYWDFEISMLEETETYSMAWKMQRQLGLSGQLLFVFHRQDLYMHERAFVAVLRELSALEYPFANFNAIAFRLIEEL
jgi:hypothetical protein